MAAKPPPFEPGFVRRTRGARTSQRSERAEYVIDPPAPAWLHAGFAVQAIGQSGQAEASASRYAPSRGPRPGICFDLRA